MLVTIQYRTSAFSSPVQKIRIYKITFLLVVLYGFLNLVLDIKGRT
jgi:hypothetical protein